MTTADCDHQVGHTYAKLESMVVGDEHSDVSSVIVDVMGMYEVDICCGYAKSHNQHMTFTIRSRDGLNQVMLNLHDIVWLSENFNNLTDVPVEIPDTDYTRENMVHIRRSGTRFRLYSRVCNQKRKEDDVQLVYTMNLTEGQLKRILHYCLINSIIKRECS